MIFDTHAHYDDAAFDDDRETVLRGLAASGVSLVCDIGSSLSSSRAALALAQTHDYIYAAVGIHPDECPGSGSAPGEAPGEYPDKASGEDQEKIFGEDQGENPGKASGEDPREDLGEAVFMELERLARSERCVAIGEIGLDYHGFDRYENKPSRELQMAWFRRQLALAASLGLPAVIHSRNACEDTLSTMRWAHDCLGLKKAVIHCFSYSRETALQYTELGYFLGFGGSVTYEGQKKISKVLNAVPLESIVLETDCPYLAPVPRRGERNQSGNLTLVRDRIAEIRGCSPEEIETAAFENGCRLYGISL